MTRRTIVLATLLLAALIAGSCSSSDSDPAPKAAGAPQSTEYGTPEVDGEPLVPAPSSGDDPAIGTAVPAVTSNDFAGKETALVTPGTPTVVLVGAHWCPHCQADVEALRTYFADGGEFADGVDFVVLHTWPAPERGNWPASAWLEGLGDRTVLDDKEGTAANALGLTGTPMWLVIDSDGNVVERMVGNATPEQVADWSQQVAPA